MKVILMYNNNNNNNNILQFAREASCSKGSASETLTAYVHFTVFKNYMYIGQYDIQIEQINCRSLGFMVLCIYKYSNKTPDQMHQSVVTFIV
jgi:hypothetical protein